MGAKRVSVMNYLVFTSHQIHPAQTELVYPSLLTLPYVISVGFHQQRKIAIHKTSYQITTAVGCSVWE